MAQALRLQFRPGVSVVATTGAEAAIDGPSGQAVLRDLTPGLLAALRTLASGGATEADLSQLVLETDGGEGLALLYYRLRRWARLGLVCYTLAAAGEPLATVVPMTADFELRPQSISAQARFRLSRFAYCRREGDALVLESPLSSARTILPGHTGAALVAELAQPRTCRDLHARVEGVAEDTAEAFLSLLVNAAVVAEVTEDDALPEDAHLPLVQWEFHDLLFHARSRPGRHDYPVGATFRFLGRIRPRPALEPKLSESVIPLYRPDLELLEREEPSFTSVLESRRSIREFGDPPITVQQLGEFLCRVGRVRGILEPDPSRGLLYEISNRPYPSAGATYDLELYVTINTCEGLAPGIYHYDPLDHQLRKVADRTAHVEALLRAARQDAELSSLPQVLITLASRFQRLSWKYSGMAYATILKNVGVLYQTMYLVATAMGLAPCALAVSNSTLFAQAVGTDYLAESPVGEFLLGSAS